MTWRRSRPNLARYRHPCPPLPEPVAECSGNGHAHRPIFSRTCGYFNSSRGVAAEAARFTGCVRGVALLAVLGGFFAFWGFQVTEYTANCRCQKRQKRDKTRRPGRRQRVPGRWSCRRLKQPALYVLGLIALAAVGAVALRAPADTGLDAFAALEVHRVGAPRACSR